MLTNAESNTTNLETMKGMVNVFEAADTKFLEDLMVDGKDVKKDYCTLFTSESEACDFNEKKEAFVARLMMLDDSVLQKLLDEATEENHAILEYNRKLGLEMRRFTTLMKYEAKIKDSLEQNKEELANWEEKYNDLNIHTTSKLADLNEKIDDQNKWLDMEITFLQQHIVDIRNIQKKMKLLIFKYA